MRKEPTNNTHSRISFRKISACHSFFSLFSLTTSHSFTVAARPLTKENPATLSYPNTHPSFLGREGPWSCGKNTLPSSQSSRNSATSLDLSCPKTSIAPHSLFIHLTAKGGLACRARGDPFRGLPNQAKRCRPISAHAFNISAETKGLFGTSFETATFSFVDKKKSSPCGPDFPRTSQQVDAVRRRTLSHGSRQGQTPSL